MTQRNKYRSPWARQWFGRKPGESLKMYEYRKLGYLAMAAVSLALFAAVATATWWQHSRYKEPPQREMNGAVRHSARMIGHELGR